MSYRRYRIVTEESDREILLAFLSQLPFESFEETDWGFFAYLPPAVDAASVGEQLGDWQRRFPFTFSVEMLEDRNWNEVWEANFPPIRVGDFCGIRADFHPPLTGVRHEIVINPRMAFGTGHHATTYLMIEAMQSLPLAGTRVLDFGAGTGILAILAVRLGAAEVDAVEIEEIAVENARDNARRNDADGIGILAGGLERVVGRRYDIILANINRNVIFDSLPALYSQLSETGILLVSGLLEQDEPALLRAAEKQGFIPDRRLERAGWICRELRKP